MKGKQLGLNVWPWLGGAMVVVIGTLVGYWHAEPQPPPESNRYTDIKLVDHTEDRMEKIEQALAQAGCPGWMALASEGPSALGPEVIPPEIRTISARVPRVKYPQPLRVASRVLKDSSSDKAVVSPDSSGDPDDLLDGTADLLWKDAAPAEETPSELPAVEVPDESAPVSEPSYPANEPEDPSAQTEELDSESVPVPLPAPAEEIGHPTESPFAPPPIPTGAAPHSLPTQTTADSNPNRKSYCDYVADSLYPSAFACATCHEKLFEEWSVSSHAYAAVSPMFQKFEQKINDISQATVGYFCYRCHSPAGVSLGISRAAPLWDMPQVAREGVTCVACHRVNQRYGKVNGERRIEPGDIFAPVYGSIGGSGVAEVIAHKNEFKVKTSPSEQGPGQDIHIAGCYFDQLSKPEFCVSCHQVAVQPGIKLEVVWEQYRASPACKKGISCQDCHMGRLPGVASGYETGPAAVVNGKTVNDHRKHANHVFYGPGYSIAHPGVFPFNKDALRWSMLEWLQFDYRAGWGTEAFEEAVEQGNLYVNFPPVWANVDDRYDARDVIDDNQKKLGKKDISRHQIMENGSHVDGPFFDKPLVRGQDLRFHYIVTNRNDGHNMPSGSLGAQPQLWANVVLIGPRGQRVWESGYTDRWGDVADIHSEDVRNKRIPYDWQLFNLQTMFLITGATGTDREFFLPVNVDIDQLPYLRPGAQPISVMNHPPFIRMEGRSLAPLGSRRAPYKIPAELIKEPGYYRLSFRLRMRTQPIYFMRFCGATMEMQRAMNEGITDFHHSSYEFEIQ
ncbi:multiheme c-type cytochrome [Bythopirellula goksoeyrii]|uniref:Cytochrome c-552/4 domain-containing protein n=1 Tax=Bythopirellula goksoeyrii TaxID=1400387 RepID=A0A5B9Q296_9BACT|nr:multiheme c-type cytochrome [Bythopirellula goksoeyrii]QEG33104.1 hypothetical protein Pr1d_03650 [Bythopirellula goksoeyrii]